MNFYEIHVTVNTSEISRFISVCSNLNLKPIILHLQDQNGNLVLQDVMTSSKFKGCDFSVNIHTMKIIRCLEKEKFNVVRNKIETSPTHPLVPTKINRKVILTNNYFESHIRVLLNEKDMSVLRNISSKLNVHISKNIYKKEENGMIKMMASLRHHHGYLEDFSENVKNFVNVLQNNSMSTDKIEIEYILYDSNISHDDKWIGK